jgi:hypothetical protein
VGGALAFTHAAPSQTFNGESPTGAVAQLRPFSVAQAVKTTKSGVIA